MSKSEVGLEAAEVTEVAEAAISIIRCQTGLDHKTTFGPKGH